MTIKWEDVKATVQDGHIQWKTLFDDRQLKEIDFNAVYAYSFAHGTEGHNARLIMAKMKDILDAIANGITITMTDEEPK